MIVKHTDDLFGQSQDPPELFGADREAWEEGERCLYLRLRLMAEMAEKGVRFDDDRAIIPPEYQERAAELDARYAAVKPQLERISCERGAARAAPAPARSNRGIRL